MTPWTDRETDQKLANVNLRQTAIDITAEDLAPRLNATNVADLVLISMVSPIVVIYFSDSKSNCNIPKTYTDCTCVHLK